MATNTKQTKSITSSEDHDFGKFDFVKWAPLLGGISLVLTVISLILIWKPGLNYGLDFRGGTEIQVRFDKPVDSGELREAVVATGVKEPGIQSFGGGTNEFLIRLESPEGATEKETNDLINANVAKIREALKTRFQLSDQGLLRVDTVGPQVGSELKRNGFLAAFYCFLVILIYVSVRFDYKFAPGAVICLVHDSVVTVGVFALLGREFNVQIMAAILSLIGYSLNDTIVTFDRIRETTPKYRNHSLAWIINKAINDMFVRTILTALTTMIAVVALYFFGGGVISEIAFTLIIGIIAGVYSSIYVAAPLILVADRFKRGSPAPQATPARA